MSYLIDTFEADDFSKTEHLELLAKHVTEGFLSGRHRSKLKGGTAEFAEHRSYSPGDEIRLLDWRVFGKSDRYVIKQFEDETSLQAIFVVDASGSMGFGLSTKSKFEYSRRGALCLARLVFQQRDAAGLAVIGGGIRSYVPPRSAPKHLEVLIEHLRQTSPSGPTSLATDLNELAQRVKRRGMILLFSDCFDDVQQVAHSLKLLRSRRHEVVLFHVLAPEELSFPFHQWTQFESLEQADQRMDLDPVEIRAEYLNRLREFLDKLRQACGESGCDYVPFSTDNPLGDVLADYLRRRAAAMK